MGKSVPKGIKSKATVLLKEMPDSFTEKFATNKLNIVELKLPFSKWTTNVMAGFITRYRKKEAKAAAKKEEAKAKREATSKVPADMAMTAERPKRIRKEEKME